MKNNITITLDFNGKEVFTVTTITPKNLKEIINAIVNLFNIKNSKITKTFIEEKCST